MSGERLFRALVLVRGKVVGLAMSWTKGDTARTTSALTANAYKLLPRGLRDLLDDVAAELGAGDE